MANQSLTYISGTVFTDSSYDMSHVHNILIISPHFNCHLQLEHITDGEIGICGVTWATTGDTRACGLCWYTQREWATAASAQAVGSTPFSPQGVPEGGGGSVRSASHVPNLHPNAFNHCLNVISQARTSTLGPIHAYGNKPLSHSEWSL